MSDVRKKLAAEVKRNTTVLEGVINASDLRISYKTEDGWRRIYTPPEVLENLREVAEHIIGSRLKVLVPSLRDLVVDEAMEQLVAELNDR